MATKTFTDKKLRNVVSQLEFDEPERTTYTHQSLSEMFRLPEIHASINYNFDNGLVIRASPVIAKKLGKYKNDGNVSLEDRLEFKQAEDEILADYRKREAEAEKEFKEKTAFWRKKFPNYRRSKNPNKSKSGLSTISMAEIERPTKHLIGMSLGGPKHHLGILIKNYEDTDRLTAKIESALVTYQTPKTIMNYDLLKGTTDMKSGDLVEIMGQLKERYDVGTSYKDGEELKSPAIGNTCLARGYPLPLERQNNVFSIKLTPRMTVKEMVGAITRVYQAGEAFKDGYNKLVDDRNIREDFEKQKEEIRQDSILKVF
jgi:hypothetical protein